MSGEAKDLGNSATVEVHTCLRMLQTLLENKGLNETARKETLLINLRSMFPGEVNESKLRGLASGAETYVKTSVSTQSQSTQGFIDTHNGKVLIEFKADLTKASAKSTALLELKRYVSALWKALLQKLPKFLNSGRLFGNHLRWKQATNAGKAPGSICFHVQR